MDFLSCGQVARQIGVSRSTVHKYIENGYLIPDRVLPSSSDKSGKRLFKEETVKEFIERQECVK